MIGPARDPINRTELVFLLEAVEQAEAAVRARHKMDTELAHGTTEGFWDAVERMLSAAVRVSNIFWPSSNRARVKRRARMLRARFDLANFGAYPDLRNVRNGFEHIDERIDDWADRSGDFYIDLQIDDAPGAGASGIAPSVLESNTARSYNPQTKVIRVFGESLSADALANELIVLRQHLKDKTGR
ncbi:hypothetical protein [Curtobacterium flaccumfaciens]|uniref:hypothetical protein n=1 Tax=Curtobacterium flaccumfaciens TaxID=2035 RepID=UPI00387903F6